MEYVRVFTPTEPPWGSEHEGVNQRALRMKKANEPIRAEVLRQQGIAAPYISPNGVGIPETFRDPNGYWTGFAARARVLIVHRDASPKPTSILSYTDPRWRGGLQSDRRRYQVEQLAFVFSLQEM